MDVSVIIVNYNTCDLTLQCLNSIYTHCKDIKFEIILIDNSSTDNSVGIIKEKFPQINLISNSENIGFGRANNIGIEKAIGKYLFLLNSDTILLNNAIKIFMEYMEKNNTQGDIGAIGCIMYDKNMNLNYRNSYFSFPGIFLFYKEAIKSFFKISKSKYLSESLSIERAGKIPVDFIVGADLFIPKKVIDIIGNFDPKYFMYWEEVDLQFRMHLNNFGRFIIGGPKIIHLEGGSSESNKKVWQRNMETQSLLIYFRKHTNRLSVLLIKIYLLIINVKTVLLNKYSFKEHIEYFKLLIKS